jgi:hypothetical protein
MNLQNIWNNGEYVKFFNCYDLNFTDIGGSQNPNKFKFKRAKKRDTLNPDLDLLAFNNVKNFIIKQSLNENYYGKIEIQWYKYEDKNMIGLVTINWSGVRFKLNYNLKDKLKL